MAHFAEELRALHECFFALRPDGARAFLDEAAPAEHRAGEFEASA
jgi:hypothetical protein